MLRRIFVREAVTSDPWVVVIAHKAGVEGPTLALLFVFLNELPIY
jgi:hypothetical protein